MNNSSVFGAACSGEGQQTQRGFETRTVPFLILIVTGVLILLQEIW